ncbi:carcinoembryonic antigen-related cell adhesion molecule 1-like isoform X2 [Callorhinchus milii]|uniref:carcinoembryonic antigen-related cell adhesion molecule 1-like isoform X2 n=1 Tax=Callorhinchus milii TaxID=7868 RepID=UPI001C3F98A5|nr:carcinoembryonic antigen-related cell adhesion molecule 1-like isoform X2 [Callorhinchus milii]
MGSFPTYSWALGGHPLPVTPRYTLSADNSTLTISPVHRSDSGGFICTASNLVSSDSSKPVKLVITYGPDPPTVEVIGLELCGSFFPGQYCGKEGDLMTLNCQTKCFPECNYRWTHNTAVIAGNTSQLPIESLTFNNSGDYTCNVKNDYTTISRTEKVSILVYRTPTQQITCGAADKGTALVLMCSWAGGVPDSVLQLKVGQMIVNGTNEGNVTITKDQLSSREIFTCVGRHVVSDSQCSIVIDKPQRASGSEPQVEVGKEADVTLDVSLTDTVRVSDPGLLPAHFTWSKEGNSITGSDDKFIITSGPTFSKLLISKFQATDQGTYQCRVTNAVGENLFQFDVTLKDEVNVGLIVGVTIGVCALVIIVSVLLVFLYRKRKRDVSDLHSTETNAFDIHSTEAIENKTYDPQDFYAQVDKSNPLKTTDSQDLYAKVDNLSRQLQILRIYTLKSTNPSPHLQILRIYTLKWTNLSPKLQMQKYNTVPPQTKTGTQASEKASSFCNLPAN